MPFHNFVSQRLGFQYLYPFTTRKELGLEVGSELQPQFIVGIDIGGVDFALAVVQGKVAQELRAFLYAETWNDESRGLWIYNHIKF